MPIHIGKIIQAEVLHRGLTYKQVGVLIYRSEKSMPLIYKRATMSIDLIIAFSVALKKDFLKFYYEEEPMKSLRADEMALLQQQVKALTEKTEKLTKELTEKKELVDVLIGCY
jgi:hypothetical protein